MTAVAAVSGDQLEQLDASLRSAGEGPLTLAPDRRRAHLPSELARMLLTPTDPAGFVHAVVDGMSRIYAAVLRAFPGNLLWDFDGLFGSIIGRARSDADPTAAVTQELLAVADLQNLFGKGPINFRYVHDFIYGFDWAKWVAKAPADRASVGPYDRVFIAAMHGRGRELLDVIARDVDEKYPPLRTAQPRNPFGFSRDPADELQLHRTLAQRDLIPVIAWSLCGRARWDRPFAKWRGEVAAELGLTR